MLDHLAEDWIEFEEHGVDVRCCGGGGLLQASSNEIRMAIAKKRLDEAIAKGAKILTSACPACKLAFQDSARNYGLEIEILDIMELAARQLDLI